MRPPHLRHPRPRSASEQGFVSSFARFWSSLRANASGLGGSNGPASAGRAEAAMYTVIASRRLPVIHVPKLDIGDHKLIAGFGTSAIRKRSYNLSGNFCSPPAISRHAGFDSASCCFPSARQNTVNVGFSLIYPGGCPFINPFPSRWPSIGRIGLIMTRQARDRDPSDASVERRADPCGASGARRGRVAGAIGTQMAEFACHDAVNFSTVTSGARRIAPPRPPQPCFHPPRQILGLRLRARRLSLSPCPNRSLKA